MYTYIYLYIRIYPYIYVHIRTYTYIYLYIPVYTYIYLYIPINIPTYIYMCLYVYICNIYMYTPINTYRKLYVLIYTYIYLHALHCSLSAKDSTTTHTKSTLVLRPSIRTQHNQLVDLGVAISAQGLASRVFFLSTAFDTKLPFSVDADRKPSERHESLQEEAETKPAHKSLGP